MVQLISSEKYFVNFVKLYSKAIKYFSYINKHWGLKPAHRYLKHNEYHC